MKDIIEKESYWIAKCECGWGGKYRTEGIAKRSLASHQRMAHPNTEETINDLISEGEITEIIKGLISDGIVYTPSNEHLRVI